MFFTSRSARAALSRTKFTSCNSLTYPSKNIIITTSRGISTISKIHQQKLTATNFLRNQGLCRSISSTPYLLQSEGGQEAKTEDAPTIELSPEAEKILQKILQLDVMQLSLLQALVSEKVGVFISDADLAPKKKKKKGSDDGAEEAAPVEEKTAFDLKLTGFDAKSKIKVIKEVRSITGLGLKEAKEMVEGSPKVLMKDIKKEEAEELKAKIEAVGGTVEIE